VQSLR